MFDSTKPPVMLTQTDIDPELQKLQMEWADLLMNDDIVINVPQKCDLSSSEKELLAGRWCVCIVVAPSCLYACLMYTGSMMVCLVGR